MHCRRALPLLSAVLLLPCSTHAATSERLPPASGCLDARTVAELRQPDASTLAIATHDQRYYRLRLQQDCPGMEQADHASLLAQDGWVCGQTREFARVDAQLCPIAAVQQIDAQQFAGMARAADHGIATLPTVAVTSRKTAPSRGFRGSYSYCFNPRFVRSWNEDPEGLTVDVSPRRNGGHRAYRIELTGGCPVLASTPRLQFESGMDLGVICGNPGDSLVASFDQAPASIDTTGPDLGEGGGAVAPRGATLRMRETSRCGIAAVYPSR